MALTVILEDENNAEISALDIDRISEGIVDNSNGNRFRLLKYVDPYGDTVFNRLQMDDLISDLDEHQTITQSVDIKEIISLAVKCKSEPHLYLTFYGD